MEPKLDKETQGIILEHNHVYNVYEKTSKHFADIEQRAWPKVKRFLQDLEPGSLVADIGCGNGRYLSVNKNICVIGSDRCQGLVDIAGAQGHQVLTSDNLQLPFRDGSFDAVISISVIHHFSTRKRRSKALCELARILKPGGKVLIYVMAMEQHLRKFESQDVLVPWHFESGSKSTKDSISQRSSSASLNEYESPEDNFQGHLWANVGSSQFNGVHDKSAKHLYEHNGNSFHISKNAKSSAPPAVTYFTANSQTQERRSRKLADTKERSASLSDTLKSKFLGFLGKDDRSKSLDDPALDKQKSQWHKDMDYKKLVDYIMMEEAELLNRASLNVDNSLPVFAVREFPGSSSRRKSDNDLTDKYSQAEMNGEGDNTACKLNKPFENGISCYQNGHNTNGQAFSDDPSKNGINSIHFKEVFNGSSTNGCMAHENNATKPIGVDMDTTGLHNWIATTAKAIEVVQAQVNCGFEPKQEVPCHSSKLEAISQYKDRMASQMAHTSPDSISSNTSSDYENDISIATRQSSDTCSVSSDSWSDFDNLDGQVADQLDLSESVESPENIQENTHSHEEDTSPAYHRYYHVFKEGELCDLIQRYVKSLEVTKSYYDHANWCVIAEKLP